jgi:ABC-type multidrug transport system fused ATPase/permease subunit
VKREYWKYLPTIFPYVRRHKFLAIGSVLLTLVAALAALLEPWPLAFLIDSVLGSGPLPRFAIPLFGASKSQMITFAVVAGFVITAVAQVIGVLGEYVSTRLDQYVSLDFRGDLFEHCQRLSQEFHDHASTGDFMYRINVEAKAAGELAVALPPLLQSILTLVGMFVVAYTIDARLALISLVVVPFVYYSTGYYGKKIEPRLIATRGLEALSLTMVNDAMAMLKVITAFNRQDHEHRLFKEQGVKAVSARVRVTVAQTLFSLAVALVTAAGIALVLFFGAHAVLAKQLSVGQLIVVLAYIRSIYDPLGTISATMAQFQTQLISIRYAKHLLETHPDVTDRPGARKLPRAKGAVQFENVHFAYRGRPEVLSDISFEAPPGAIVAIVGPTGAGKSTLVSHIPRFLDPSKGRISVDGQDIRDLTLHSLRAQIGFVQQEPLLFSRSIGENIRYGRLDAGDDEVVAAAKAANAHEFIMRLPQKYETPLGERGARISGGERQRIAIARAFLKDAPILVLDEPTSSIDSQTEQVILDALDALMAGRTTFIVAHRLSTIRAATQILVMSDGRIVERGSHEDLVREDGLYALLHKFQAGARQPAGDFPAEDFIAADVDDNPLRFLELPGSCEPIPAADTASEQVAVNEPSQHPGDAGSPQPSSTSHSDDLAMDHLLSGGALSDELTAALWGNK